MKQLFISSTLDTFQEDKSKYCNETQFVKHLSMFSRLDVFQFETSSIHKDMQLQKQ